ncbi:hypothetical protein KC644_01550 [Candidatus Berkelbacteria bacterium]|nr:hypothetical protein [Candidatus Berkelbacteria bacterium]
MKKLTTVFILLIWVLTPIQTKAQNIGPTISDTGEIGPGFDTTTDGLGSGATTGATTGAAAGTTTNSQTDTTSAAASVDATNSETSIADSVKSAVSKLINIGKVSEAIKQQNNINLWKFFRSFVNYVLVAMLLLAAFSTVIPIGPLDNYTIKKILPSLILGFVLANLSLFISETVLNFAESIVKTFESIGGGASGAVESIFSNFSGVTSAVIAIMIGAFATSGAFGLILGPILIMIILAFPLIIQVAFLVLFVLRHIVIQFLVIVSPLAFMALGTPFTRSLFQTWWKQFSLWVFLKPIGWALLTIGGLIIQSKIGGDFVAFIVGLASMVFAIIIPFTQGGKLAGLLTSAGNWARRGLAGGTLGAGGLNTFGSWLGRSNNRLAQGAGSFFKGASRTLAGTLYAPEALKARSEETQKERERLARGLAEEAIPIGSGAALRRARARKVAEAEKEFQGVSNAGLINLLQNSGGESYEYKVALTNQIYSKGIQELMSGSNGIGPGARGRATFLRQYLGRSQEATDHILALAQAAKGSNYLIEANLYDSNGNVKADNNTTRSEIGRSFARGNVRTMLERAQSEEWVNDNGLTPEQIHAFAQNVYSDVEKGDFRQFLDKRVSGGIRSRSASANPTIAARFTRAALEGQYRTEMHLAPGAPLPASFTAFLDHLNL